MTEIITNFKFRKKILIKQEYNSTYNKAILVYNLHCITVQSGQSIGQYDIRTNFNGTVLLYTPLYFLASLFFFFDYIPRLLFSWLRQTVYIFLMSLLFLWLFSMIIFPFFILKFCFLWQDIPWRLLMINTLSLVLKP